VSGSVSVSVFVFVCFVFRVLRFFSGCFLLVSCVVVVFLFFSA